MKNKIVIIIICIFMFMCGVFLGSTKKTVSTPVTENIENKNKITYREYQNFFEYIVENIKIDGFDMKTEILGESITFVDKEMTFGKRDSLTINGDLDDSKSKPTEGLLFLESKDGVSQIAISLIYTDRVMDNDLLTYVGNTGFGELNPEFEEKYKVTVSTFKNLAFVIIGVSTESVSYDIINKVNMEIITLIEDYKI